MMVAMTDDNQKTFIFCFNNISYGYKRNHCYSKYYILYILITYQLCFKSAKAVAV